jgi:hypothetical protein
MTLDISRAVGRGVSKLTTVSGGAFAAVLAVFSLATATVQSSTLEPATGGTPASTTGLTLPVSPEVGAVLSLVGHLIGTVLVVALSRAMVRDERELESIPADVFTRRIGMATVVMLVVTVLVLVAVGVGMVFLLVPGLFLLVSFLFVSLFVAVEDHGVVASIRGSWALASGHRLELFGVVVFLLAVKVVTTAVVLGVGLVTPIGADLLGALFSGVTAVYFIGVVADAYVQLRDRSPSTDDTMSVGSTASTV